MGVIYWIRNRATGEAFDLDKHGYHIMVDDDPDEGQPGRGLDPIMSGDDVEASTARLLRYVRDRHPGADRSLVPDYEKYVRQQWHRWRARNPGPLEIQNDASCDWDDDPDAFTGGIMMETEYDHRAGHGDKWR